MRLRPMLAVPTAVIVLVTCVLVATLSLQALHDCRRGEQARQLQFVLRQLLVLQETLARERMPTNIALNMADPLPRAALLAIEAARGRTEAQIQAVANQPDISPTTAASLAALWPQLRATRARIDALLRLPVSERGVRALSAQVDDMMHWSEALFPAIGDVLQAAVMADPESDSLLTAARAAADLRFYAGSIGGWLTIAVSRQQPLSLEMISHVRVLQGQVSSLRRELLADIRSGDAEAAMREAMTAADQHYFGDAQQMIDRVVASEAVTGDYDPTRTAFLDAYHPAMASLVALRDQLLDLASHQLDVAQRMRLHRAALTGVIGVLVVLTVVAALLTLHRRVFRPLTALAAMVIRLAEGDRTVRLPVRHGNPEIAELARAIEVLREATLAADAEAARRRLEMQRWTTQLQEVLAIIDLLHDRTATMTALLPALLHQLDTLAAQSGRPPPGLAEAIVATREGIAVLHASSGRLDDALQRIHAAGDGEGARVEDLQGAMQEVAHVVATIEASVNGLPHMTLAAVRDMPRRATRAPMLATLDSILAQVQEMAAAAGGLHNALLRANQGIGELARLRA